MTTVDIEFTNLMIKIYSYNLTLENNWIVNLFLKT